MYNKLYKKRTEGNNRATCLPRRQQLKSGFFFYPQNVMRRTLNDHTIFSDKLTTHFCTIEPRGLSSHSSTRNSSVESLVSPKMVSEPRLAPTTWYGKKMCSMFVTLAHNEFEKFRGRYQKTKQMSLLHLYCYFTCFIACLYRK